MNAHFTELPDTLQPFVDAVQDQRPDPADCARAQRELMQRLARRRPKPAGFGQRALRWAPATAALLMLPLLLIWLPGSMGSVAFADVQRYFNQFDSMIVQLTTTMAGEPINEMTVRLDSDNRTRLDSGDAFTFIIDPRQDEMLQLFHDAKLASRAPLESRQAGREAARLGWLDDLRSFQGEAELLDTKRTIAGRDAVGFALQSGGLDMILWAAEDGEPLRLEMQPEAHAGPTGIEIRVDFSFDQPLDPRLFSLEPPPGYRIQHTGSAPLD